jgi:PEP-CTERM motif
VKNLIARLSGAACAVLLATSASAMVVTQTTVDANLITGLGGAGLTIDSVSIANGADGQFGTYTGFTSAPVTIGDGVVLSTGNVVDTVGPPSAGSSPSTNEVTAGTTEFDTYGSGHITNFAASNDVAALMVTFTLAADSQVGFDFIFGSIEYPVYVDSFTDAFLAFLDGTTVTDQIVFDASANPVQVGSSFAGALTTADTNSAFANPHGLLKLQTFTNVLTAGQHTLLFEVGDVNDHILDSAVFISNFHAGEGQVGTGTGEVPEPASMGLVGLGVAGLLWARRRKLAA